MSHAVKIPDNARLVIEATIAEADLVHDIAAIVAMDNTVRRLAVARAASEGVDVTGCSAKWVPLDRTAQDAPGQMRVLMWLAPRG